MPLTVYAGKDAAVEIAGNHSVLWVSGGIASTALVPTITELDAATTFAIECGIKGYGVTAAESTQTEQYLCDLIESETLGSVRYSIDEMQIVAGDPQSVNALRDSMTVGAVGYLVDRRGPAHGDAYAAGDVVSVAKVKVARLTPAPTTANTNGDKFQDLLKVIVLDYKPYVTVTI